MFIVDYKELNINVIEKKTKTFNKERDVIFFVTDKSFSLDDFTLERIVKYVDGSVKEYVITIDKKIRLLELITLDNEKSKGIESINDFLNRR